MKRHLIFGIFLFAATVHAQTFRGAIEGTVTDATGAAVTQANVTVAKHQHRLHSLVHHRRRFNPGRHITTRARRRCRSH